MQIVVEIHPIVMQNRDCWDALSITQNLGEFRKQNAIKALQQFKTSNKWLSFQLLTVTELLADFESSVPFELICLSAL